jgi:hypothetical protein
MKNADTLTDASKVVDLREVRKRKETKYEYIMSLSRYKNAGQDRDNKCKQIVWKCVTVHIFGNDSKKSKFDSGGN